MKENNQYREMKDSGIEWIGKIPASWTAGRVKNAYTNYKIIAGCDSDKYQRLALTLSGVIRRSKDDSTGLQPEAFNGYQILRAGDLVFKLIDLENYQTSRVGLSPYEGIVSPAYIVLKGRNGTCSEYGEKYFLSMWQRAVFNQMGDDGVRSSLNSSDLLDIPYIMPPYDEQRRIASFLDTQRDHIDSVLEKTRSSIEEYKKLKQAVITQAVTKGVRGERPMKNSGIEWIGEIPAEWSVFRIANLFDERSEGGLDELPILTVSINTGVSDHEIADEDKDRVFIRSVDRTKYKRVYPGDLVYNMMRAWQGAFGAVRVDGMVSPAYVVAKPKKNAALDNRYIEALLRTPEATEEMHRYSRGIVDFRLRLYWPEFRNIQICLPSFEEQQEIANYIDEKSTAIDQLIKKKKSFVIELENYKKSLIYEYVTGKKVVPAKTAEVVTVDPILLKALLYMKVHELLGKNCRGRIQIQKMLYLIESMNDTKIGSQYIRQKYGPLDMDLDAIESFMEQKKWLKAVHGSATTYRKLSNYKAYRLEFSKYWGNFESEIERIIRYFENMKTSQAERFATLMAAWNDFILDGNTDPSDEELIQEVTTNWHPRKANFSKDTWQDTVNKMRANHITPHGYGKHTIQHLEDGAQ